MTPLLNVNVFTAPQKAVVGERPRPFGPPIAWDPITSTLIFGENDAVLVDTLTRWASLSDSETRILRYLPTHLSAPEIAGELYLSVHTVKTHMRHLYAKFGTHQRAETVERARALGLLAPSPRQFDAGVS